MCSLKRRGFENSYDSEDCVVLFGVGNTIMKGSKQASKIVGNNRNLPKLQDDAIMKVLIDRYTQTIRWYHENEELGSTTLP